MFAFVVAGIASVSYEHLFNKKVKITKPSKFKKKKRNLNFAVMLILFLSIFFGGFFFFKLDTFIATIFSFIIPTIIIYIKRPDLIKNSVISGLILLIIALFGYQFLNIISPGFFENVWKFQNVGKIIILNIPLEEYIWYFLFGAFFGPLYEYWQEAKLVNLKKK